MGCLISKHTLREVAEDAHTQDNVPGLFSRISSKNPSSHHHRHRVADLSLEDSRRSSRQHRRSRKHTSADERTRLSLKSGLSRRHVEAEQVAAGWPTWLISAASEAIHGWVPLRAEAFEKLEKIGQGTYSSVFRAREVETGKIFALKKVKFDNFQPESIRFMAREIIILRKLDHPNVIKLEGIITSRISTSIYFVFDYMEHDLAGLSSCPDIKFTESQIKCYMHQLLRGLEHCHTRGIIHRDIKASNILVNNQGILKIGDFGLANMITPRNRNQLTSRVVTLWYRAPELLMGSTSYGASVDLWSVGCVFAEIQLGKPILRGRTEIEQLHKIYKLCGSPPEDFWKKSKLPQATMFKPQHSYESSLRERCKGFSIAALNLLETLLSMVPERRGTASAVLNSQYFLTKPYACDPSTLPKYPPNKELDAKYREEKTRRRASMKMRDSRATKKSTKPRNLAPENKYNPKVPLRQDPRDTADKHGRQEPTKTKNEESFDTASEASQATTTTTLNGAQGNHLRSNLLQTTAPGSGFAWACPKKHKSADMDSTYTYQPSFRSHVSGVSITFANKQSRFGANWDLRPRRGGDKVAGKIRRQDEEEKGDTLNATPSGRHQVYFSHACQNRGGYQCQDREIMRLHNKSGPLELHSHKTHDLLYRNEANIRRAVRQSYHRRDIEDR